MNDYYVSMKREFLLFLTYADLKKSTVETMIKRP